jgi:TonB family protein
MKLMSTTMVVLLLGLTALAADPEPYIKSAPMPFYPPLARQASVEGSVKVSFVVDALGDTSEIEADGGDPMLKQAATESVRGWKFAWRNPCSCRVKREAYFFYRLTLTPEKDSPTRPCVTVKWFDKTKLIRVDIESDSSHVWRGDM